MQIYQIANTLPNCEGVQSWAEGVPQNRPQARRKTSAPDPGIAVRARLGHTEQHRRGTDQHVRERAHTPARKSLQTKGAGTLEPCTSTSELKNAQVNLRIGTHLESRCCLSHFEMIHNAYASRTRSIDGLNHSLRAPMLRTRRAGE